MRGKAPLKLTLLLCLTSFLEREAVSEVYVCACALMLLAGHSKDAGCIAHARPALPAPHVTLQLFTTQLFFSFFSFFHLDVGDGSESHAEAAIGCFLFWKEGSGSGSALLFTQEILHRKINYVFTKQCVEARFRPLKRTHSKSKL